MAWTTALPEAISSIVQGYLAYRMLDAQKEARDKLQALADESLTMSEDLFEDFKALRGYDNNVYNWDKSLPLYAECDQNIQRGRITGHMIAGRAIQQSVFGNSRYNCGNRQSAISAALSAGLIAGGEQMANAYEAEENLVDAHISLRWRAISSSAAFETTIGANVFGQVGDSLRQQDAFALTNATGSLASAFNSASRLKNKLATKRDEYNGSVDAKADRTSDAVAELGKSRAQQSAQESRSPFRNAADAGKSVITTIKQSSSGATPRSSSMDR